MPGGRGRRVLPPARAAAWLCAATLAATPALAIEPPVAGERAIPTDTLAFEWPGPARDGLPRHTVLRWGWMHGGAVRAPDAGTPWNQRPAGADSWQPMLGVGVRPVPGVLLFAERGVAPRSPAIGDDELPRQRVGLELRAASRSQAFRDLGALRLQLGTDSRLMIKPRRHGWRVEWKAEW